VLTWLLLVLLLAFTLRRFIMIVASALPPRPGNPGVEPSVAVIVAAKNEEARLPNLLRALDRVKYSPERICFVMVDDGSRDITGQLLEAWAATRTNARCVRSVESVGKAQALNLALRDAPETELVAVYDADLTPCADSLRILAGAFLNPRVAAAVGYRRPSNAGRSPVAAYGALEYIVHQLVTQVGKQRLALNPTTLGGNCVYRRGALRDLGGFPAGALSEDIEVSLALVKAGWRTHFCPEAVADSPAIESLKRFWNQRSRWTRGLYRSSTKASGLESWLVSAGYVDRLVFLATLALSAAGSIELAWPALYLSMPAAAMALALWRASLGKGVTAYVLFWTVPMFAVDIAVSVAATVNALLGRRQKWPTGPERA
jgi:cellulose synthase/poly-beta-1,6-N-acetylglucosamine synthase-like glycosyltransferase